MSQIVLTTSDIFTLLQIVTHIPGDRNRRGIPILFEGEASRAKTALIEQYGARTGIHVEKFLLSQINADELVGIPSRTVIEAESFYRSVSDSDYVFNETNRAYPVLEYIPQKWAVASTHRKTPTIVFFDEFNMGAKDVLDAAQTFLTHGKLGDLQLPPHVTIIGAQNPAELVGGTPLSPPMASRWLHIDWSAIPTEEWLAYVEGLPLWYGQPHRGGQDGPLMPPEEVQSLLEAKWPAAFSRALNLTSAYLRANQSARYALPPLGVPERQKGWPCDRQWVTAARVLAGCDVFQVLKSPILRTLVFGCIGEAHGTPFLSWLAQLNLPTPQQALDGTWVPDPKRPDIAFLVQKNLILWASELPRELLGEAIHSMWQFVITLYDAKLPDYGHLFLQALIGKAWFIRDQKLLQKVTALAGEKALAAMEIGQKPTSEAKPYVGGIGRKP